MVNSMTAFARQSAEGEWGRATWELRSVNHRFLDLSLRLPEDFRALESRIRESASRRLKRGKVDCTLRVEAPLAGDVRPVDPLGRARRMFQAARGVLEAASRP